MAIGSFMGRTFTVSDRRIFTPSNLKGQSGSDWATDDRTGAKARSQWIAPKLKSYSFDLLYGTVAGEQALDREFGIDGSIIDGPQENAQALLVAEYVRKTERYEPRAKVARVEWTADKAADGMMIPKVVIELV